VGLYDPALPVAALLLPLVPVEGVGGAAHGAALQRGRRRPHPGVHLPHPATDAHQVLPRPVLAHPLLLLAQVRLLRASQSRH